MCIVAWRGIAAWHGIVAWRGIVAWHCWLVAGVPKPPLLQAQMALSHTAQADPPPRPAVLQCVDIVAPGTSIVSAGIAGDAAKTVMSGTSMATPHVAGVAAVVLQVGGEEGRQIGGWAAHSTSHLARIAHVEPTAASALCLASTACPPLSQAYPTATAADVTRILTGASQSIFFQGLGTHKFLQASQPRLLAAGTPASPDPAPRSPAPAHPAPASPAPAPPAPAPPVPKPSASPAPGSPSRTVVCDGGVCRWVTLRGSDPSSSVARAAWHGPTALLCAAVCPAAWLLL